MPYKVKSLRSSHLEGGNVEQFQHVAGISLRYHLFLQQYQSIFSRDVKFKVVYQQSLAKDRDQFELWSGSDAREGKQAFDDIKATLEPLLIKGAVLTKSILHELILPNPVGSDHIVHTLETRHNNRHPEWRNVVEGLQNGSTALNGVNRQATALSRTKEIEPEEEEEEQEGFFQKISNFVLGMPSVIGLGECEDDQKSTEVWEALSQGILDQMYPCCAGATAEDDPSSPHPAAWLVDTINNDLEKTAIHMILSRFSTRMQCSVTRDTPLHAAVRKGNTNLVKLLLAYQADPTIQNAEGKSPMDEAKNQTEILEILQKVQRLREEARQYYSKSLSNEPVVENTTDSDKFLLGLDGGGMKVLITCHILAAIEARMKELDPDCQSFVSYFDFIAGTSAGSILGALLLYNCITSVSNAGIYLYKFMQAVFMSNKSERQKKLKDFIANIVGESTVLSDIPKGHNIIITTTIANVSPYKLCLMTNYNEEKGRKVWEALLASSAAPTYFPPVNEKFLDGGLMSNNPTLPAMTEICRLKEKEDSNLGFVLSVGTGFTEEKQKDGVAGVFVSGLNPDTLKSMVKLPVGMINLLDHFMEQTLQSDGEVVRQARYWCKSIDAMYERLSPMVKEEAAADMASLKELVDLLYETEIYILTEYAKIDKVARRIVQKKPIQS